MPLILLTPEEIQKFPINHRSPSSQRMYLTDRQQFAKQYIRYEFSEESSPSLFEGQLFHSILEQYYSFTAGGGKPRDQIYNECFEKIVAKGEVAKIDRGKTGSLEKSLKTVRQCVQFYYNELPAIYSVIAVESNEGRVSIQDLEGNDLPIPIKSKIDLVWNDKEGDVYIEDHKTVTSFTDPDDGDIFAGKYFIQAHDYWLTTKHRYGVEAKAVIFREVKKSENRDKSPQVVPYIQAITPDTLKVYFELYKRMTLELAGKPLINTETGVLQFLPNPFDFMAKEGWLDFVDEVVNNRSMKFVDIQEARAKRYPETK